MCRLLYCNVSPSVRGCQQFSAVRARLAAGAGDPKLAEVCTALYCKVLTTVQGLAGPGQPGRGGTATLLSPPGRQSQHLRWRQQQALNLQAFSVGLSVQIYHLMFRQQSSVCRVPRPTGEVSVTD